MLSTTKQEQKARSIWTRFLDKVLHSLGFQKWYNVCLFIIMAGAMLGFTFARLSYINISGSAKSSFKSSANPGEWYWYRSGAERIGITLHLCTILPAGFLVVWQFVPIIRHKFLIFHRINGYVVILLIFMANAGALMIARHAFGGSLETQAGTGTLAILTTTSICLAYYNIKRLQIDQHRAWMLRAIIYLGTIITLRIIMNISNAIISGVNSYNSTMSCDETTFIYETYGAGKVVPMLYPQCNGSSTTLNDHVVVHANSDPQRPEQIGARGSVTFGMAFWVALILHVVGVEIYLALTPRESNRLRQVSYERQVERGFRNPGSAGLTSDRWGDAEAWQPIEKSPPSEFEK